MHRIALLMISRASLLCVYYACMLVVGHGVGGFFQQPVRNAAHFCRLGSLHPCRDHHDHLSSCVCLCVRVLFANAIQLVPGLQYVSFG